MVEIPRFRRKELNLALVKKRGPGQRFAWAMLWIMWLVNGLAGLVSQLMSVDCEAQADGQFFDVNIVYMLIQ
jgi:hypothetical protein